jgi:hypothetical protein
VTAKRNVSRHSRGEATHAVNVYAVDGKSFVHHGFYNAADAAAFAATVAPFEGSPEGHGVVQRMSGWAESVQLAMGGYVR